MVNSETQETCNEMTDGRHLPEHLYNFLLVPFCYQVAYACLHASEHG